MAQRNRDEQLNRQIVRLQRQLERANLIIDAQKKLCALLDQLTGERNTTLAAAFKAHQNRFKGLAPKPPAVPTAAWINPPKEEITSPEIIVANSLNSSRQVS